MESSDNITHQDSDQGESVSQSSTSLSRRAFLGGVSGAAVAAGVSSLPSLAGKKTAEAAQGREPGCEVGPATSNTRATEAFETRLDAALFEKNLPLPDHPCNSDERTLLNRIGSFTKALPHDRLGHVEPNAYLALVRAVTSGNPEDYERIPLGGGARLVNPQAALAFELLGPDSHHLTIPPAPAFSSAEEAGEMVEVYWQALTRDVHFSEYDSNPLTKAAADDLSRLDDFRGPRADRKVTTGTLFRGNTRGDLTGPYISQFLWKPIPYGPYIVEQRGQTTMPGSDHITGYDEWRHIQNGGAPRPGHLDPTPRYIRNGRDLGEWVHRDFTYQGFLNAALILMGLRAPVDQNNPYRRARTQAAFATFGGPDLLDAVAAAANRALKAAWFQKWQVHRRLRPEEFGGRVHNFREGEATYPIHMDVLYSAALEEVFKKHGSYLLPMAYPEGCPTHPAYPAGHAAIAGACATVLKAYFDESFVIPDPVVSSGDGLSLTPYTGRDLTVGGELNKLAANIAIGRDTAGVHWRTDGIWGLLLGEALAIRMLREVRFTYNEAFRGFSLTRLDGETITI